MEEDPQKKLERLSREKGMSPDELKAVIANEKEWRVFLLAEINIIKRTQLEITRELGGLQVKSGIWGAAGGVLPVIVTIGIYLFKGGH